MNTLENFFNWLLDIDWMWFPFLKMRPKQTKEMTTKYVLKNTLAFGLIYYLPIGLILLALGVFDVYEFVYFIILVHLLYFFLYKFLAAFSWNRRARRLSK